MECCRAKFSLDMTWVRLILLSLSKKQLKKHFQTQRVPATGD